MTPGGLATGLAGGLAGGLAAGLAAGLATGHDLVGPRPETSLAASPGPRLVEEEWTTLAEHPGIIYHYYHY